MSTVGAEQREILMSFGQEIQPQLATVTWSLRQLIERPGDQTALGDALQDLQTLQAVISILELESFEATLGTVRSALAALGRTSSLTSDQRQAAGGLVDLLYRQGQALIEGDVLDDAGAEAAELLRRVQGGNAAPEVLGGDGIDLDDLLGTLGTVEVDDQPTIEFALATIDEHLVPPASPVVVMRAEEPVAELVQDEPAEGIDVRPSGTRDLSEITTEEFEVPFRDSGLWAKEAEQPEAISEAITDEINTMPTAPYVVPVEGLDQPTNGYLAAEGHDLELTEELDSLLDTLLAPEPPVELAVEAPPSGPSDYDAVGAALEDLLDSLAERVTAGEVTDELPARPGDDLSQPPAEELSPETYSDLSIEPVPVELEGVFAEATLPSDEETLEVAAEEVPVYEATFPVETVPDHSFHEQGAELVVAMATVREAIASQAEVDDSALVDLVWAARSARAAAALAGRTAADDACALVEHAAEAVVDDPERAVGIVAFLTTAEEVLKQLLASDEDEASAADMVALLSAQLGEVTGEVGDESDMPAGAGWGDLPPEVLAELDGVDIESLDDETLARLSGMLDAFDAARAPAETAEPVQAAELALEERAAGPYSEAELEPVAEPISISRPAEDDEETGWALLTDVGSVPTDVAPTTSAAGDAIEDEFEAEIRAVFLAEAEEHLASINQALLALDARPDDHAALAEIRRSVHTLKGASGAVGMMSVADFCHVWEDALDAVEDLGVRPPDPSLLMECAEALERYFRNPTELTAAMEFSPLIARLAAFAPASENGPALELRAAPVELPDEPGEEGDFLPSSFEPVLRPRVATTDDETAEVMSEPAGPDAAVAAAAEMLRVTVSQVDQLVGLVGELVVQRSGLVERLERLGHGINELDPSLARLRRIGVDLDDRFAYSGDLGLTRRNDLITSSAAEFDELEFDRYGEAYQLARELIELASDLGTTRRELGHLLEDVQLGLVRQGRITTELHDQLLNVRLVPLATLGARLQRTVRQAALHSRKDVAFVLEGGQTQMDKALLEEIADPLLHLLRNAVDHGIESAEERAERGKPATGTIRVIGYRVGNEVVVQVRDDGAGIDPARVLARARERGMIGSDTPDSAELANEVIFAAGFSTASSVTGLSGRGIGLDVVRAHLARAKGIVTVTSEPGRGTTFTLRVPALLVVTPSLTVKVGEQRLALPLAQVRRVQRVTPEELVIVGSTAMLAMDDETAPLRYLSAALGGSAPAPEELPPSLLVVVVAVGDRQVPVVVDEIVGQQEAVVRSPAPPFDVLPGLAGTTIQGNGEVLLVLNVLDMFAERAGPSRVTLTALPAYDPNLEPQRPPLALVVDDSLSVRRVVSRALTLHGWKVQEARDGIQAIAMVQAEKPDVILLDVEMPRMDGYEVLATLKRQEEYQDVPIVMLTSRGGEKHRRRAFELGADAYLVKPYQETVLLQALRDVSLAAPRVG